MKLGVKELVESYPEIKHKNKSIKLEIIGDDLFTISNIGRIERVINGDIIICRHKNRVWNEFEVTESQLIDKGLSNEELSK